MTPRAPEDWHPPQLATLAPAAPDGADWVHEIKYDGYRMLAWIDGASVRLLTRNRKDWTDRFPELVRALVGLNLGDAVLDGEVGVELPDGRTSFQALQNVLKHSSSGGRLRFWLFDALRLDGEDLTRLPLVERKARLRAVLSGARAPLRYSEHVEGRGPAFHEQACRHGLEGIISKRSAAPYRGGRSRDWLKVKCVREQEFVVGGYTAPGGSRQGLGALHVGTFEDGRLVYRGKVGTGYTENTLRDLVRRLKPLKRPDSPFADGPRAGAARGSTWVDPVLVAQVRFTEVTDDGRLRHPVFHGLREDKDATEVVFEGQPPVLGGGGDDAASDGAASGTPAGSAGDVARNTPARGRGSKGRPLTVAGVRLTSPDKVLYPEAGVTKLDLARYYETVAEWMLPHLRGRPLTLVRCPAGHTGACFFQKHFDAGSVPDGITLVDVGERDGSSLYGTLDSLTGILSLVQLGCLELHSWNSRADRLERPDRFVMDIDPDPGVGWDAIVDAALHLHDLLAELGLVSFLKTSGGKGLHVVVPIDRRTSWADVRAFSGGVASLLSRAAPHLYTTEMAKAKRKGRILLDYLRNARGATAIEAYSTRARPGAPVAAPIHWDELLDGVRADSFNVHNMAARMTELGADPWADLHRVRQSITRAMLDAI
jgi:bifunctional non-homologous end joining protein LigD